MNYLVALVLLVAFSTGPIKSAGAVSLDATQFFKRNPEQFHGKLIIDTDCGADDAVAILLALAHQKEFEILGITTSVGNTLRDNVIINVLKTQRVLGTKYPVYPGAENSTLDTPAPDNFYGKDGLGDVPDPNPPKMDEAEKEHAVMAMIRLVKKYPGEITIVALGPLTNVAWATRIDPSFRRNIKNIIWTGGAVEGRANVKPGIEFNAYFDPAANYIVFQETSPPVIMCPWEMFLAANTGVKWRRDVLGKINSPQMEFLNAVEHIGIEAGHWNAADSKTMSIAVDASIVEKASYHHVFTVYEGEFTKGLIIVDYRDATGKVPNAIIVQKMSTDKFKDILLRDFA